MRIAIVSATINPTNGYGNITYEYCKALYARGIDFELFLPVSEKGMVESLGCSYPVHCTLPPYIVRFNARNIWAHFKTLSVKNFDIVHSLLDIPFCFMAARSARKYKLPFMMGSQGTYGVAPLTYSPDKFLLRYSYETSKKIVVPSKFTKDKIIEYAMKEYPIDIIHNGVNFERFQKKVDTSAVRGLFPGKKILLTVGNFKERRGQDLVMRALGIVSKKRDDVAYVMVGGGETRDQIERLADELNLRHLVHFAGQQKDDALLSYFQGCDIYIHTPRVKNLHFEGFGIVYLEASACEKPIIATDAGGIRDAVLDNQTGLVVGDENVGEIAQAIERLLDDAALRERLGQSGHQYAKEHDWSMIAKKFISLYEEISHV